MKLNLMATLMAMLILSGGFATLAEESPIMVEHHYKSGETLWFISLVYYGKGGEFKKIVEANHLTNTEGLKDGQLLKIPNSPWKPDTAEFKAHYQDRWIKHQARLHQEKSASTSKTETPAMILEAIKAQKTDKSEKPAKSTQVEKPVNLSDKNSDPSPILVVPLPASPLLPPSLGGSGGNGPSAEIPGHRSASEGTDH